LHYTDSNGWQITGPPLKDGLPFNPRLAALAVTSSGEGWAVGSGGIILHRAPGDAWRAKSSVGTPLESVSVAASGAAYATGENLKVLKLSGDSWAADPAAANLSAQTAPDTPDLVS